MTLTRSSSGVFPAARADMSARQRAALHRLAESRYEAAAYHDAHDETDRARDCLKEAFTLEAAAARSLTRHLDAEPERSTLFHSAASLALACDMPGEAIGLARAGLEGQPPRDIAKSLRGMLAELSIPTRS